MADDLKWWKIRIPDAGVTDFFFGTEEEATERADELMAHFGYTGGTVSWGPAPDYKPMQAGVLRDEVETRPMWSERPGP